VLFVHLIAGLDGGTTTSADAEGATGGTGGRAGPSATPAVGATTFATGGQMQSPLEAL